MNQEYFKNFINTKDSKKLAYSSYLIRIEKAFEQVKIENSLANRIKLESELQVMKDCKSLTAKDKLPIFRYFFEKNIDSFAFLSENNGTSLRIMKIVQTNIEGYKLNWKEVWQKLIQTYPQIPTSKFYSELAIFLKIAREYYDEDNADDVITYFLANHGLYADYLYLFISLFVKITNKTQQVIFNSYIAKMLALFDENRIKANNLIVILFNAIKNKGFTGAQQSLYQILNKIVMYSLSTPADNTKESIQGKFNKQIALYLNRIIGKSNIHSVKLLRQIFQIIQNFIRPFEDSKRPLRFLQVLFQKVTQRIYSEENYQKKIQKLKAKEAARLKNELSQVQKSKEEQTKQQIQVQQKEVSKNEKVEQKKQEEDSEQQQEEQNETDDQNEQKQQNVQNGILQIEQNSKTENYESKIQKLQSAINNRITPEIKECIQKFLDQNFQNIFFVNSKGTVYRILREIFKLYPKLISWSFVCLQKAINIPQINEEGLINNIQYITRYLFNRELIAQGSLLENVIKILNRIKDYRKITDVWQTFEIIYQKIPLLDQKDLEKIQDTQKQQFQKRFNQNHDSFYENYSQIVFYALKRLFLESQHYDKSKSAIIDKKLTDMLTNCYPAFKKRVIKEIQENIMQNNNRFLLTLLNSQIEISPSFSTYLSQLVDNINTQNDQNLELDIIVNLILSANMDYNKIKVLVRSYSKKNNYKFLKQSMLNLSNYSLIPSPSNTSLNYFYQNPKLICIQEPSYSFLKQKIKFVYDFSQQLLTQLLKEVQGCCSNPLNPDEWEQFLPTLYKTNGNVKLLQIEKRKTINELIQIIRHIYDYLFHQLEEYDQTTNTIKYREAPYKRQSLVTNQTFIRILKFICSNEVFLHDQSIIENISSLLENQIFFMYRHQIFSEKEIISKNDKYNRIYELPKLKNLNKTVNNYVSKSRIFHFSLLHNQYRDSVDISAIQKELLMLLIAPGHIKNHSIYKIMLNKSDQKEKQAEILVKLFNKKIDSRFYYQKIYSFLNQFRILGIQLKKDQIVEIIDSLVTHSQSQNIKIRQQSLKALEKFVTNLNKDQLIGQVEHALRKYINKQKLEIVWIMSLLIILKQTKKDSDTEYFLQEIYHYMKELENLIRSDVRILRRLALFTYSLCYRKMKKELRFYTTQKVQNSIYAQRKTLQQFFESGFLRPQHQKLSNLENKVFLKKLVPYETFKVKNKKVSDFCSKIQNEAFNFLIDNAQLSEQTLRRFHTDMATSVAQVLSMMTNKKNDLAEVAMKLIEGTYVYTKLKKIHMERIEMHFGQRFFRYLFIKDAKHSFSFFNNTKQYLQQNISNLESYDNQTIIYIYCSSLLNSYQKNYDGIDSETKTQIQTFLIKIFNEIIYKGSSNIFKKIIQILNKNENKVATKFLTVYLQQIISQNEKISRCAHLLLQIHEDNYDKHIELAKHMLDNKYELNNNFINVLINLIINFPSKYIINKSQIQKYQILDIQKLIEQNRFLKYKGDLYLYSINGFNQYFKNIMAQYIQNSKKLLEIANHESKQQNPSDQVQKERNEFIKNAYNIITHAIGHYIQSYQLNQTIEVVKHLLLILFNIFDSKRQIYVDFQQFEQCLKSVFSNKFENINHFEELLKVTLDNLRIIPNKKQSDVISILAKRPSNFLFLSRQKYINFILQISKFEQNSMIYRELLLSLSTIMAYNPFSKQEIDQCFASNLQLTKNQKNLILQAFLISSLNLEEKYLSKVMKQSTKERRNIWCKEIIHLRGKREYLENQQNHQLWKQIKQYSNPYHYHA